MRRRRVAGWLRDLIAGVGFVRDLRTEVGQRVNAGLELAIVIDLHALIGIWGVRGCASGFRTPIFC